MPPRLILGYASCPDALLLRRRREATVLIRLGTHVLVLSWWDHLSDMQMKRGPRPCGKSLLTRRGI